MRPRKRLRALAATAIPFGVLIWALAIAFELRAPIRELPNLIVAGSVATFGLLASYRTLRLALWFDAEGFVWRGLKAASARWADIEFVGRHSGFLRGEYLRLKLGGGAQLVLVRRVFTEDDWKAFEAVIAKTGRTPHNTV